MATAPVYLLRAFSALLAYPDGEVRAALPEIADTVRAARELPPAERQDVLALVIEIQNSDPLEAEARYVDLFDRGRHTSLNLFEHVLGDDRQRGPAMLELRERYQAAGMEPVANELPDHLPLMLEYLSCCDAAHVRSTINEIAHVVRKLGNVLLQRKSRYASVMAALLALGHEKGLDPDAEAPPPDDIDAEWAEKPAFERPNDSGNPGIAAQPVVIHPRKKPASV